MSKILIATTNFDVGGEGGKVKKGEVYVGDKGDELLERGLVVDQAAEHRKEAARLERLAKESAAKAEQLRAQAEEAKAKTGQGKQKEPDPGEDKSKGGQGKKG